MRGPSIFLVRDQVAGLIRQLNSSFIKVMKREVEMILTSMKDDILERVNSPLLPSDLEPRRQ